MRGVNRSLKKIHDRAYVSANLTAQGIIFLLDSKFQMAVATNSIEPLFFFLRERELFTICQTAACCERNWVPCQHWAPVKHFDAKKQSNRKHPNNGLYLQKACKWGHKLKEKLYFITNDYFSHSTELWQHIGALLLYCKSTTHIQIKRGLHKKYVKFTIELAELAIEFLWVLTRLSISSSSSSCQSMNQQPHNY